MVSPQVVFTLVIFISLVQQDLNPRPLDYLNGALLGVLSSPLYVGSLNILSMSIYVCIHRLR